jgi:hypothetical protein
MPMSIEHPPCADGTQAHRWRLASPTPGVPTVTARCLRCGAERVFRAYLDELEGSWKERAHSPIIIRERFRIDHLPF